MTNKTILYPQDGFDRLDENTLSEIVYKHLQKSDIEPMSYVFRITVDYTEWEV